jgi:porphobilinogen synthase
MYSKFHNYRTSEAIRNENAEVKLEAKDFIFPYFVVEGKNVKQEIASLYGICRLSADLIVEDLKSTLALGIDKILLFGVPDSDLKNELATNAYATSNLVAKTITEIKKHFPDLFIITDVCLCAYTNHGHCGVITGNNIDNEATLPLLAKMALSHARAGANMVAPSAMMDGQVAAIRAILDENGFENTQIMGYSAKFASAFYGPFREAADSTPSFGDRKTYQMDYRTIGQPLDEIAADIAEGANWVMVKPGHTYLDVICRAKQRFNSIPLAAYQVSGEYAMIMAAQNAGFMNAHAALTEALFAFKRAGADFIISYYAKAYLYVISKL